MTTENDDMGLLYIILCECDHDAQLRDRQLWELEDGNYHPGLDPYLP